MSRRFENDEIERARAVPIAEVIANHGINLKRQGSEFIGPCPACGGTDRFSINPRKNLYNCRQCGGGDTIALAMLIVGCDFPSAVRELLGDVDNEDDEPRKRQKATPNEEFERQRRKREAEERLAERRALLRAGLIWDTAGPIAGTPGQAWLATRGITLDGVPQHGGLRWYPACPWEAGTQPCILARFTDVLTCEPKGIHRRPVTGEKPRTLGPMAGCVIRLWPDEDVAEGMVIGEGIETTLAAATQVIHRGTLLQPAWAGGSAGNLETFPVLAGIEALTILTDNDASGRGQQAAHRCGVRWREAGREVTLLVPRRAGFDFNDIVLGDAI